MARRSKLTPDVQQRICQAIELGATYDLAAKYGGIAESTFYDWLKSKSEFSEAIKSAEGKAVTVWLAKIERAASDGNWQAAAWKLERRYPQQYGKSVQEQEHSGVIRIEYVNDWRAARGATARGKDSTDD